MSLSCTWHLWGKSFRVGKCLPAISNSLRHYRNRPTHNIGRMHGLEKPKPPPVRKKEVGTWKPEEYKAVKENHLDALNFIVSGYDIVLVEQYAKYVHQLMIKFKQNILEVYALPSSNAVVKKMLGADQRLLKAMTPEIELTMYKRIIQVKDMPSQTYPILLQTLMHYIPQSITLKVDKHNEEQHLSRYQYRVELAEEKAMLQQLYDSR
ncbi:large ribosomal subunit protein mL48-like isoform X2 [Clavelina lepadiformis]